MVGHVSGLVGMFQPVTSLLLTPDFDGRDAWRWGAGTRVELNLV